MRVELPTRRDPPKRNRLSRDCRVLDVPFGRMTPVRPALGISPMLQLAYITHQCGDRELSDHIFVNVFPRRIVSEQ